MKFSFVKSQKSEARAGVIELSNGRLETPAFLPDATYGFIKSLPYHLLEKTDTKCLVTNTLHLFTSIGTDDLDAFGGLHNLTGWQGLILTDSGGFQVLSLINNNKNITKKGVKFKMPNSSQTVLLTPELSLDIQRFINSDIRIALDYCIDSDEDESINTKAVEYTVNWAYRAEYHHNQDIPLFAVIQGGSNINLRKQCFEELHKIGFDGYCYGGWPMKNGVLDSKMLSFVAGMIPNEHPKYAMGVGTPSDIIACVKMGYDIFDTVLPTRNARHGYLFTSQGIIRTANAKYKYDDGPIDSKCNCPLCRHYSRAYLRYLYKIKSINYYILASIHNLQYYQNLMQQLRTDIINGIL